MGISEQQMEHIFEPFWQADSSSTRERGGVGLGLYLVQLLISALGGEIAVESHVGRGSRFTITLPTRIVPEPGERQPSLAAAGQGLPSM